MSIIKFSFILCAAILLSGCLGGVWTGANLIYDRHNVYHEWNDYDLNAIIRRTLYKDNYFHCAECHLDIAVLNGDVLLAGHVETEEMRQEAYKRVKAIGDYRRLFEKISIEPIRTDVLKDSWITAKIRSEMIADSAINPRAFKVVTSDQTVYLMGDVMPDQAEWVVSIARDTTGVKRVVKLMKYYHLNNQAIQ
jgi:osmotically-inducible protein OsmY